MAHQPVPCVYVGAGVPPVLPVKEQSGSKSIERR